jgi:hypothetical protein
MYVRKAKMAGCHSVSNHQNLGSTILGIIVKPTIIRIILSKLSKDIFQPPVPFIIGWHDK